MNYLSSNTFIFQILIVHSERSNDDAHESTHTTTNKTPIKHVEKNIQGSPRYLNPICIIFRHLMHNYIILISLVSIFLYLGEDFDWTADRILLFFIILGLVASITSFCWKMTSKVINDLFDKNEISNVRKPPS